MRRTGATAAAFALLVQAGGGARARQLTHHRRGKSPRKHTHLHEMESVTPMIWGLVLGKPPNVAGDFFPGPGGRGGFEISLPPPPRTGVTSARVMSRLVD